MRSLLQQLENNESVLLMYLADELPAEDRAEIEQLLSVDAGLRRELSKLQGLHDSFTISMSALDGMEIAASMRAGAARKVSRLMARQATREAVQPVSEDRRAEGRRLRIGGWAYPVAVAAVILLAVGWWGRQPGSAFRGEIARQGNSTTSDLSTLPIIPNDSANSVEGTAFELTADRDADRSMVSVAAASVDVSSMFELDADSKGRENAHQ
jgi:anti-sigma factor RsiW